MPRLRVAMALSQWLRFPSVRRIVVNSGQPLDAYDAPSLARDVRRLAGALEIADAEVAIARARTIAELQRLHDHWTNRLRAQDEGERAANLIRTHGTANFPPAPILGTEKIVYLGTVEELLREGREMHHCVGGYVADCMRGAAFIYQVLAPEKATLEVRMRGGKAVIGQLKLAGNGAPTEATWQAVRAWIRAAREAEPAALSTAAASTSI